MNIIKNLTRAVARTMRLLVATAMLSATATAFAVDYFEPLAMEGVELVSAVTWGKVDEFTVMQRGLYEFGFDNKFAPNKTQPLIATSMLGGCVYHDGKIYANEFSSQAQDVKPVWRIYDAKTYRLLSEHELGDNCSATTTSMAYDPTTDRIFAFNETYTETYVVSIDPETGAMTRLGDFLDRNLKFLAIACSPTGELYCTYLNKNTDAISLGKIRKSTGQVAMVRGISATNLLSGDSFINSAYEQAMFYNNATGKLYWMFESSSQLLYKEYTAIFEVNPVTADAVMVAYIEDGLQTPGAFFMEPDMKAPAIIDNFEWTADADNNAEGTISLTLPTTAYDGTPLTGNVELHIESDDIEPITVTTTPGATFARHITQLANGWNTLHIYVTNASGEGPHVTRKFFAGYDAPKAPTNVALTADGLHTTLTWDAPTEGVNGEEIDNDRLTYTVVRYPNEVVVAEGLKDCRFEEDHPAELTRYVYKVTPMVGSTSGRSALSNNLVVGLPIDVPYGDEFYTAESLYNYFTILDSNKDNYTWMYDAASLRAVYSYNMAEAADDWLISPPINYQAGKEYKLTFSAFSSSSTYKESLKVTFGNDKTPEAQDSLMLDLPEVPVEGEEGAPAQYELYFKVPHDGVYYFAFHAVSERFREHLYIGDVIVKEGSPTAVGNIGADAAMSVRTENGELHVALNHKADILVTDLGGRTVAKAHASELNLPLASGVYIVTAEGCNRKVVVD